MHVSKETLAWIVKQRFHAWHMALLLAGCGGLVAALAVWFPGARIASVTLTLLSLQFFQAHHMLGYIERLSAALYMKQTALKWGDESDLR